MTKEKTLPVGGVVLLGTTDVSTGKTKWVIDQETIPKDRPIKICFNCGNAFSDENFKMTTCSTKGCKSKNLILFED